MVSNPKEANRPFVSIMSQRLRVYQYKEKNLKLQIQYNNCQKYGYYSNLCQRNTKCTYCALDYRSTSYKCPICNKIGKPCKHTGSKYSNCQENHFASSKDCSFAPKQYYKSSQEAKPANLATQNPTTPN